MIDFVLSSKATKSGKAEFINFYNYSKFKNVSKPIGPIDLVIGILSDYTVQPICQAIELALSTINIKAKFVIFPIESTIHILQDKNSDLYSADLDILVVYPDFLKFLNFNHLKNGYKSNYKFFTSQLLDGLKSFKSQKRTKVLLHNSPYYGDHADSSEIDLLNNQLNDFHIEGFHIVNLNLLSTLRANLSDERLLKDFRISIRPEHLVSYAGCLLQAIRNALNMTIKIVIVDLDETLWPGILGENNIDDFVKSIGSQSSDLGFDLANILKGQKESGTLLAISSKNYDDKVVKVFIKAKHFPLKIEDFVLRKVNWNAKSENVLEILKELQFSSLNALFIDNSKVECAEVKESIPGIAVLRIDNQVVNLKQQFNELGYFWPTINTKEDYLRIHSYKVMQSISNHKDQSTFSVFLSSLKQQVTISELVDSNISRVKQMFLRTNQFRANSNEYQPDPKGSNQIVYSLTDIYTDYGTIGFLEWQVREDIIFISQWLMSCRVFNRDIEDYILNFLIEKYAKSHVQSIMIDYHDTDRNQFFANQLDKLGFRKSEAGAFERLINQ
jgi:FkbH-like protein